ncbi:hypothetical protein BG841_13150 [Marinobacter sp. X15-166B]|nr:hypothetical protein BG841_13150 [Marinobacter sp. X15-166B]
MVNWNDIKYFIALARHQRLSKAAAILGTTHVTVSNRLLNIERSLGFKLFTQNEKGFKLTKQGITFFRYAKEIEHLLALGLEETAGDTNLRQKVRVGVTEEIGDTFLARRLTAWLADKNLDVDYISLPKTTTVTSRKADISITLEEPHGEHVIKKLLTSYILGVYASRKYLTKCGEIDRYEALEDHRWIGYIDEELFSDELKYHHEISNNLNFVFQSTSILAQREAARNGLGLSILPNYMAKTDKSLVRVLPDVEFVRQYWISTNRDLHRFDAVNTVWKFLLELFSKEQDLLFRNEPELPRIS